jgi:hypothetical protein
MGNPEIQDSKSKANDDPAGKMTGFQRNYSFERGNSPLAKVTGLNYVPNT